MDPLLKNLGPIFTLLGVLGAAWFTYRASNRKLKTDSSQQIIEQQQEDLAEERKRNAALQRQVRIQGDYIGQLRRHVADGNPPPPPSWPDGLIT